MGDMEEEEEDMAQQTEGNDLGCGTRQGMSSEMGVKMHWLGLGSLFTGDCSSSGPQGIFSCVSLVPP